MKHMALIVLGMCPAMLGLYLSRLLRKRVEILEKIELMFSVIESNISFFATPSSELVQILTGKEELYKLKFLEHCYERILKGDNFYDAWMASLDIRKNTSYLTENDIKLLRLFCENFGTSDIKGEISNCRFCTSLLKDHIAQARLNKNKYSNIFSGLGFLTGVALIVVLS